MAVAGMTEMVQGVIDHAEIHYEDGGWDVIAECWTAEMIEEALRDSSCRARSITGAVRYIESIAVSVYADRQADARNSAF